MTSKPLRVLQVLPALNLGGVERGTLQMARSLIEKGVPSFIASSGGKLLPELLSSGATHFTLPLYRKTPWAIYQNSKALEKIIRRENITLVHARSRAPAWSALLAAKRASIPFITTYHGAYNQTSALKRFYNSVMARGVRVIAPSQFIKNFILQYHPFVSSEQITVIYRGVDTEQFCQSAVTLAVIKALREEWRVKEEQKILLFPARLSRWKGHHEALTALAALPQFTQYVLVFLGEATGQEKYQQELLNHAKTLGVYENVRFVGQCNVMPAAYAAASVVLCPSLKPEAFGRTVTEAQAMGAIVIATHHGGASETIQDGVTGFHVPITNVATALITTLQNIFALSAEAIATLENAAIKNAHENFSLAQMAAQTQQVYDKILQSK